MVRTHQKLFEKFFSSITLCGFAVSVFFFLSFFYCVSYIFISLPSSHDKSKILLKLLWNFILCHAFLIGIQLFACISPFYCFIIVHARQYMCMYVQHKKSGQRDIHKDTEVRCHHFWVRRNSRQSYWECNSMHFMA